MAPKSAKWTREREKLEQKLRRMDKELRRLKGVVDFHQTKAREVRDQLTKIGAGLSRASDGTANKRAALAVAQRELDLATSQEAQAKREVDRLSVQQGEHEAFMLTAQGDGRRLKVQRDRAAKQVKDHWTKVAVVTRGHWSLRTLAGHLSPGTWWQSRGRSLI